MLQLLGLVFCMQLLTAVAARVYCDGCALWLNTQVSTGKSKWLYQNILCSLHSSKHLTRRSEKQIPLERAVGSLSPWKNHKKMWSRLSDVSWRFCCQFGFWSKACTKPSTSSGVQITVMSNLLSREGLYMCRRTLWLWEVACLKDQSSAE